MGLDFGIQDVHASPATPASSFRIQQTGCNLSRTAPGCLIPIDLGAIALHQEVA
jgi:hypothetical protein